MQQQKNHDTVLLMIVQADLHPTPATLNSSHNPAHSFSTARISSLFNLGPIKGSTDDSKSTPKTTSNKLLSTQGSLGLLAYSDRVRSRVEWCPLPPKIWWQWRLGLEDSLLIKFYFYQLKKRNTWENIDRIRLVLIIRLHLKRIWGNWTQPKVICRILASLQDDARTHIAYQLIFWIHRVKPNTTVH